ncbi:IclR family transcriptional regulator [Rhodococcus sp. NPDC127528]|uniref:IclR family transcriptional regulator n=1 Tax=unclassified Rhodococcus (in: high G+C Gram-positive bacteria) TaxID=192944 RepID=UPI00362D66A3
MISPHHFVSPSQSSHGAAPPSTLDRVSLVMDLFRDRPRLTLTDVSRGTGIPRTSTLRMLDHLVRIGWLRRRGTEYELGDTLANFGALALYRNKFELVVAPLLRELHRVTGCVVHLGALEGNEVRYLEKVGSPDFPTRVGARVPAQSSPIGRVLLAAAQRSAVAGGPDHRGGPESGVAFASCVTGFRWIGVHVGALGGINVGLSVSGPADRVRFDQLHAAPVLMAASAIAQYLCSPQVTRTPNERQPARRA